MRLIDVVNAPWAITGDMHREIHEIYRSRRLENGDVAKSLEGLPITRRDPLASAALVSAAADRQVENRGTYTVIDNVAVIPVHDVMSKRMSWMIEVCGGCSTQILARDFANAQNDSSIKGILLYADTPGGTVDGTMEVGDLIASARGNKPVIGFTDGMICSAGMWAVCGADEIYISSDTNPIGSIGVVGGHVDVTKREEMWGRKVTEITSGEYKRIASSYAPLSKEGRAYIQAELDHIYTAFVNHVAAMRGLDASAHEDWANGRVFLGSQAINAGLVDGVSTMGELIDRIAGGKTGITGQQQKRKAAAIVPATLSEEVKDMDVKELREKHPGVVAEIETAARAGMVEEKEVGAKVATERTRVIALVAAAFGEEPGAKFGAVVEKGLSADDLKTLGISFAVAGDNASDKESRKEILDALKDGGNKVVGKVATADKGADSADFAAKVTAYAKEHNVSNSEAIKACRKADVKGYSTWIASVNNAASDDSEDDGSEQ